MIVWAYIFAGSCVIAGSAMAGSIALGKRLGRASRARREAAYLAQFETDRLPDPSAEVEALIAFRMGKRVIVKACHWPHIGWVEVETLLPIAEQVIGWREPLDWDRLPAPKMPVPTRLRGI